MSVDHYNKRDTLAPDINVFLAESTREETHEKVLQPTMMMHRQFSTPVDDDMHSNFTGYGVLPMKDQLKLKSHISEE